MNGGSAAGKKVAALKKSNMARNGYILISVVFYIAGLLHMVWHRASPLMCCMAGGVILIVYGMIKITGYLSDDLYCLAFQYDLGCGLFLVVTGILVLACNMRIWQYFSRGLGFLILLDSLMKMQMSRDAREFGLKSWNLILAFAVVAGSFGVLIAAKLFQDETILRVITGCGLLAEGALNHLVVKDAVYVTKRHALPDKDGEYTKE